MSLPPAGWYPDPQSGASERWWDGAAWTMQTRAPDLTAPAVVDSARDEPATEPFSADVVTDHNANDLPVEEAIVTDEALAEPVSQPEETAGPIFAEDVSTTEAPLAAEEVPPYAVDAVNAPYGDPVIPAAPVYPAAPGAYEAAGFAAPTAAPLQPYGLVPSYPGAPSYPGQETAVYGAAAGAAYGAPTYAQPYATGYGIVPPVGVWRSPIDNRPLVTNMIDAVKVCFQKYAQFDGRASRSEFWYFTLAEFIVVMALYILLVVPFIGIIALPLIGVVSFGALIPSLAVAIRRLRDAGQHWAWIFLALVPLAGIALIVLWCQPTKYP